jgi:CRP/FNR family transcriptional regulator, cyclic AMP receptor protein
MKRPVASLEGLAYFGRMKLPNIFEDDTPPLNFTAGQVIFSSGDEGEDMYVVKSGEVELRVGGDTVEVVKEDGFFGEMALIEEGPRTATAVARTDCSLIPINEKRFEFMVHEVPLFALHMLKGLSRRLRNVNAGSV